MTTLTNGHSTRNLSALITVFNSRNQPQGTRKFIDWNEWFETLSQPPQAHLKKTDLPGWSAATFTNDQRSNEHVEAISALVLDVDDGGSLENAQDAFGRWFGFIHTSYSHGAMDKEGKPCAPRRCFRIILPLTRPVTPKEYQQLWLWAQKHAQQHHLHLDPAPKAPGQFWYLPAERVGAEGTYQAYPFQGELLDPDTILNQFRTLDRPLPHEDQEPLSTTHPETKEISVQAEGTYEGFLPSLSSRLERGRKLLENTQSAIEGQKGSVTLMRACVGLVRGLLLPEPHVLALLKEHYNPKCEPPWLQHELEKKIHDAVHKSTKSWGYLLKKQNIQPQHDPHTPIHVGHDLHRIVDETIGALRHDPNLFQRDYKLVHIIRTEKGPRADTPLIRPIAASTLRERITTYARYARFDKRSQQWTETSPNDHVVYAVQHRGQWSEIRAIIGVLEAPYLRPDGSILQTPGYDETTGYVYIPNATFPLIQENPTYEDAKKALTELYETVEDFPFVGDSNNNPHRAAWLALLLTLFARPAIDGPVPSFGISATTRGTGKTKLADVAVNIMTGRDGFKRPFPEDDKEMRKLISPALASGDCVTFFDNIARTIESASLDNAITSRRWQDRELGKSANITAPNTTVFIYTGNNLSYGGDTVRRVLPIELESLLENPETRKDFKHPDLLTWVRQERPRLVTAALTILRAWWVNGRPTMNLDPWGSFEHWTQMIPACLVWLGEPNPLQTREGIDKLDTSKNSMLTLIHCWRNMDPEEKGLTTGQVIRELYPPPTRGEPPPDTQTFYQDMRDAIENLIGSNGKPTSLTLSAQLRKAKRRVFGQYRFEAIETRTNTLKWIVQKIRIHRTHVPKN